MKRRFWTTIETSQLIVLYNSGFLSGDGRLTKFCESIGRTKPLVCRKAKELGLTINNRSLSLSERKRISQVAKNTIAKNGHPRGMLGKKHSKEYCKKIGERVSKDWADPSSGYNTESHRQFLSDKSLRQMHIKMAEDSSSIYSRTKRGHIQIGEKKLFVRSSWEANIATYLEFLKSKGAIREWEYEAETFWFHKIKRGVRSYKPDFKIMNIDGSIFFEEVKGWMDDKSKTKLKRMKKYYPNVDLRILDERRYKAIKKMSSLIPGWGQLDNVKK